MALILSLDSTTSVCSAAIHEDGKFLDTEFITEPRAASAQLMIAAQNLLERNGLKTSNLSAIAISSGPGSYTGLRISTSAAKGLCYALDVPLIAVNSLLVLSHAVIQETKANFYCPMLDARRMEVYCALLDEEMNFRQEVNALVLTSESFSEELNQFKIAFFGDGAEKFKAITNHSNAIFVEGVQPEAKHLGYLAHNKFLKKDFESLENFEPFYLKDFLIKKPKSSAPLESGQG